MFIRLTTGSLPPCPAPVYSRPFVLSRLVSSLPFQLFISAQFFLLFWNLHLLFYVVFVQIAISWNQSAFPPLPFFSFLVLSFVMFLNCYVVTCSSVFRSLLPGFSTCVSLLVDVYLFLSLSLFISVCFSYISLLFLSFSLYYLSLFFSLFSISV